MLDDSPLLAPNRIAEKCREGLVAIEAEIAAATSEREAKALRKRRKLLRQIKGWCGFLESTRAGDREPEHG